MSRCPICGWRLADEEGHRPVTDPRNELGEICAQCATIRAQIANARKDWIRLAARDAIMSLIVHWDALAALEDALGHDVISLDEKVVEAAQSCEHHVPPEVLDSFLRDLREGVASDG